MRLNVHRRVPAGLQSADLLVEDIAFDKKQVTITG